MNNRENMNSIENINSMYAIDPVTVKQVKRNWGWYLGLGIMLNVVGTAAIIFAFVSTIFSVIYLGSILVILGVFEAIQSFKIHPLSRCILHFLLSTFCAVTGLYLIFYPAINAISLTLLLAFFFIVTGILRIIFSVTGRTPHRFWLLLNGIITLVLGLLIWRQWPLSGLWVIGMFLGIDMVFMGWNWIMLALSLKDAKVE